MRPQFALTFVALALAGVLFPAPVAAREGNQPKRLGGQAEIMVGSSMRLPRKDDDNVKPPLGVGMAFDVGWRSRSTFFLGVGYGMGQLAKHGHQQGVFGILRAYVPIWRLDIGFELAPGWSRQTFKAEGVRIYSQGFAFRPGLSLDIWLGKHIFLGVKVDLIFNLHRELCGKTREVRLCTIENSNLRQTRTSQLIGGVHVGGSF